MMTDKLWHREHLTSDSDMGAAPQARLVFIGSHEDQLELITIQRKYVVGSDVLAILDALSEMVKEDRVVSPYPLMTIVDGMVGERPVFIEIYHREGGERASEQRYRPTPVAGRPRHTKTQSRDISEFDVTVTGHRDAVKAVHTLLERVFAPESRAQVKWWYKSDHGPECRTIYLPPITSHLLPEFYPDVESPARFLQEYLDAPEAILMLAGPPGTGKTTLLRHLICDHKLAAHVVYDEVLMNNDSLFQSFLFEADSDVMVIEDADTILASREDSANTLMARFLNVSDGLIKLPDKKIVFTTNISDFGRVDSALLRPGRCFGVLHTRALNLSEAQAAANAGDLPVPMEKREYTLAELFNQGKQAPVRRVGFTGR